MMQGKVIQLISKAPDDRSCPEIKDVLPWLRKKSSLLSASTNDVLVDIVRNCDYRRAYVNDIIVTQGEEGESFYIMLSGKTSVYIDPIKAEDDADQTTFSADLCRKEENHHGDKKSVNRSKHGKFMRNFETGDSFGEIALISDHSVRNATVIADEQTDLLVIHQELFNRSMKVQQEQEYAERKEFIEKCYLFSDWSSKARNLLEMSIRKEEYLPGSHIMKQGEPAYGLVFIVRGRAKLTTVPSRHDQQYAALTNTESVVENELGIPIKVNRKSIPGVTQDQIRVRRKEGYAAAERRYMSKYLELCSLDSQEILGDMEIVMDMSTCACTVTCVTDMTVFVLDNKNYDRLIGKKYIQTVNRIKLGVLRKIRSRIATANGGQVPLFKLIYDKLKDDFKPRSQPIKKVEPTNNEKNVIISQMTHLYLKDKVALIEPLLPDSFTNRIYAERRNRSIQRESKEAEERGVKLRMNHNHRKVARSLKQLKNSMVETELISTDCVTQTKPARPKTALGLRYDHVDGHQNSGNNSKQNDYLLKECDTNDGPTGQKVANETYMIGTEEFDKVFRQLDTIHREKSNKRCKTAYSMAARSELESENGLPHSGMAADDMIDPGDDTFFDYETSTMKLSNLEQRIKKFCDIVSSRRNSDPLRVNEMKSFAIKDIENLPVSGGTVYVNRAPCSYRDTRVSSDVHRHVRRFMITRRKQNANKPSTSLLSRPKSAVPFMSSS